MRMPILSALILVAAMAVPAAADPGPGASRTRSAPIKDCTRFNGRFGYYGNLWCTKREQLIWDRATSPSRSNRR